MRHAFRIFLALSATLALAACSEADGTAEQGPGSPAAGGEGPGGKADDWGKDGRWAPGIPIGSFALRWNRTDSQLRIVDSATQRVVWETPAGADFVGAGVGAETVSSARGCFTFKDRTISSCGGATLDDVRAEGNGGAVARGTLKGCGRSYNLRFWEASSGQLAFQLDVSGDVNRVFLTHLSPPDEHLFGFGHQYSQLDMKGRRLPIWAGEQGIGRGAQPITWALNRVAPGCGGDWTTTYTAVPFYLSTHGRGFALENTEYLVFDMTKNDRVTTEVWSNSVRGRIVAGGTPLDVLKNYTTWSGRMAPLPAWTQQGALLRTRGGSGEARKKLNDALAAGAKIAALWIEDWAGERETAFGLRMLWNWSPDPLLYPDWSQLVKEIHARGVRVMIYFNPFLADPAGWPGQRTNLYARAKAAGLLVTKVDGSIYPVGNGGFEAGLVDLSNPAAHKFIKKVMREQLALGVSGWMADFGEALPYDAHLHSGDARTFHNQYPYEWAKLNREALQESGREGDALFFNRSGNARSPSQTMAFWIGDQNTTWDAHDGIKTVVPGLLSGGLSGYQLEHIDTGGWLSLALPAVGFARSKELEQRWLELGAFTALYRLHHTNRPDKNWQYDSDKETLALFARMTRLFAALGPYRNAVMEEGGKTGAPLIRHLLLHYGDDAAALQQNQEFLIGSDVLVAPVVDKGQTKVTVYLPAGKWVHAWSGKAYGRNGAGMNVTVDAPIGTPAFFLRSGSDGEKLVKSGLQKEGLAQ